MGDVYQIADEQVAISVSRDSLSAYVTFTPPRGGRVFSYDDLISALRSQKIVYGINHDLLKSLAGNTYKKYGTPIEVAKGIPSEAGHDAKIDFFFSIVRDSSPKILPNGSVDHRSLNLVQNVHKGDLLAHLTKETMGIPGTSVFGAEIKPKPGKQRVIPKGKNTEVDTNGLDLKAASDGKVELVDGKITICSELEIKGDVGAATGHIVFAGDVKINGNIISTYNVTAEGSIFIGGCIEASKIVAGKDITIAHGVKGLSARGISDCAIYAGGNITSKFIENATVFSNGTIRTDSIINSKVSSYDTVFVGGRSGSIIGGKVRAMKEIVCDIVGSAGNVSAAKTSLESGLTESLMKNYTELKEDILHLEADIKKYKSAILEIENYSNPTTAQNKRLYASRQNLTEAEHKLYEKTSELSNMEFMFHKSGLGKITVNKTMNPIVVMTIGKKTSSFEDVKKAVYFREDEERISVMNI